MEVKPLVQKSFVVKKKKFGEVNTDSSFFDSFKETYAPYYSHWLEKKKNDDVYVVEDADAIIAFLKLKEEDYSEDYSDMKPSLYPANRLKISSFKVKHNKVGIGPQLMSIVFSEAINSNVSEIYGTVAVATPYNKEMDEFLKKWGFTIVAEKNSQGVKENVYLRSTKNLDLLSSFIILSSTENEIANR